MEPKAERLKALPEGRSVCAVDRAIRSNGGKAGRLGSSIENREHVDA